MKANLLRIFLVFAMALAAGQTSATHVVSHGIVCPSEEQGNIMLASFNRSYMAGWMRYSMERGRSSQYSDKAIALAHGICIYDARINGRIEKTVERGRNVMHVVRHDILYRQYKIDIMRFYVVELRYSPPNYQNREHLQRPRNFYVLFASR